MSDNEIQVKAVRTFEGEEGFKSAGSAPFTVSRQRFADLAANGLVVEAAKAAPAPQNKAAPAPQNKAATKPDNK